jgi:hypothetical protein
MKKTALVLLLAGIAFLVVGFFLTFFWKDTTPLEQGSHVVKAGATLELSWDLQKGDRTEGFFTVSGGNEEASLSIEGPSGEIICNWYAKGRYDNGFMAQDSGVYTMILENLDNVNDESIDVHFRSPCEPRFTICDEVGLLTMLGSMVILFFGIRALRNGWAS